MNSEGHTLYDGSPFIFIGVHKIVHERVQVPADAKLVFEDHLAKFLW